MPEKNLNEIPKPLRDQYEKGLTAIERSNLDYAIELLLTILKSEPGFLVCREALRKAGQKKAGAGSGLFKRIVSSAGSGPTLARAKFMVESQPLEALALTEQVIAGDPRNTMAHDLFTRAAMAADLPRTALLSLVAMRQESPADKDVSLRLAAAYTAIGQSEKAEAVFETLMKHHPNDPELSMMMKNASANRTLNSGGYEQMASGGGSFRSALKDAGEAKRLEQESRITKDGAQATSLLEEYEARLVNEPENLKLLKNIVELLNQQKDHYRALEFYNRIEAIPGAMDAALERERFETIIKRYNQVIEQLDPAAADYEEQRTALLAQRDEYILDDCRTRVEKYPTDLANRFDLGVLYYNRGRIGEAIPEFQKAESNPNKRLQAMLYSARCFAAQNKNDMAARKLQAVLKEKVGFDEERKDVLYTYGCVLEKMGKKEESMDQFKLIYEADVSYRDVSDRVDAYYASQGGG